MHKRKPLTVQNLPFKSVLDERPKQGQYILMAWDINGYSGIESIFWDTDNMRCKHCVMWLPMSIEHLFTRKCGVERSKLKKKKPLLKWSEHYSLIINNAYVSLSKLPKLASKENPSDTTTSTTEERTDTSANTPNHSTESQD